MEVLELFEETVFFLFRRGWTYSQISTCLQRMTGCTRGLSCRSVRRFCHQRGMLIRSTLGDMELDQCIQLFVANVGHAYGRRTMQGLLRANGHTVSQARISASLRRVAPRQYHARGTVTYRHPLNSFPYNVSHYGEKLHFDQNEKITMYGVTHVVAVDGYSRKIV